MIKRIISCYILLVAILLSLCSCGVYNEDETVIRVWAGESLIGYTEFDLPQEEWILSKLFSEYEKKHPGIRIEYTYFEDEDLLFEMLMNGYNTSNMPDIFVHWTGDFIRDLSDVVVSLNDYVSSEAYETVDFWHSVEKDGKILGYPIGSVEVNFIAYNKKLLGDYIDDFDLLDSYTVHDFEQLLEKISENGIIPILSNDRGYNQLFNIFLETWWMQQSDNVIECATGNYSYKNETVFLEGVEIIQRWYKQGYINQDYATGNSAISDFLSNKGVFLPTSIYKLNILREAFGDNLGVMYVPSFSNSQFDSTAQNGGCGQCIAIVNSSKNIDLCADIIRFLVEKPNAIRMYQTYNAFPVQNNISLTELGWENDPIIKKLFPLTENLKDPSYYYMGTEKAEYYYKMGTLALIGEISSRELADRLDSWGTYNH